MAPTPHRRTLGKPASLCAQVSEDTDPPIMENPTNADDPDINRGSIGKRNLNPPRETHRSDRIKEIKRSARDNGPKWHCQRSEGPRAQRDSQ